MSVIEKMGNVFTPENMTELLTVKLEVVFLQVDANSTSMLVINDSSLIFQFMREALSGTDVVIF